MNWFVVANNIVWIGFGFALISFLIILLHKRKKILNRWIILVTNWKESWASTLTVFSGILGTLISASFFPEEPKLISKTAFQTLQIFFPILVVIAGFTVSSLNKICAKTFSSGDDNKKEYSPVWPLVLGSPLVLSAFVGELTTLIVLFKELQLAKHFSKYQTIITQVLFFLMICIGFVYVIISVGRTIETAPIPDREVISGKVSLQAFLP